MPEIPRTKFNSPWTVAVIEAALNDVSSAKGSSESLTAALNAMRAEINSLSGGVHLKGAVDYYSDLPASPSEGDAYTVRYQGTSGTDPLGIEYAWATYQGTPQWIPIGVDPSVFAKANDEAEDRAALAEIVDNGDKNKLKNTLTSGTVKGITYTINADGSITTAAGTATGGNSNLVISLSLPAGRYVLSGCPDGGSGTTYRAQVLDNTTSTSVALVTDSTEGNEFEVVDGHDYAWRFRVQDGQSITESTFYPMVCSLAAWQISPVYQPYRPSWQEMYDMILALQSGGNRALTMQTEPEEQEER